MTFLLLLQILKVLSRIYEKGLELKLKKCKFGFREIEYLGYFINKQGISPTKTHLKAIANLPVPNNSK